MGEYYTIQGSGIPQQSSKNDYIVFIRYIYVYLTYKISFYDTKRIAS